MKAPVLTNLTTSKAREAALDTLGAWIVDQLAAHPDDRSHARAAIQIAIDAFYDIRESAGQPRGEYAGDFFTVDAVGLDSSDRPVPWQQLGERVTEDQLAALSTMFDELERGALKTPPRPKRPAKAKPRAKAQHPKKAKPRAKAKRPAKAQAHANAKRRGARR